MAVGVGEPVRATWTLATPSAAGAVAIIQIHGDIDGALAACGIKPVSAGQVLVRDFFGIDRGVVARWGGWGDRPRNLGDMCQLMPHGGSAVVRAIVAELTRRGVRHEHQLDPRQLYLEARSDVEAHALAALARAASPLAVDLLLDQHRRWGEMRLDKERAADPSRDPHLNRLIDPALVVAVGGSNIGKSTLVNALAGRGVSVVADEPGTTRDHVGVLIDLAGLVVRYVDTPGLREGAVDIERQAAATAMQLAASADLLLICGDATADLPPLPAALTSVDRITVALRTDLGPPSFKPDARVSVNRGEGLVELVAAIKERLVPQCMRTDGLPWRFW